MNASQGAIAPASNTRVTTEPCQEQPLSANGRAALDYAENEGFHVFPAHSIVNGACSCWKGKDCESPGKHPLTANGFKDATTDPDQIREWWTKYPNANVAIETGTKVPPNENGSEGGFLFVIDIDPRNGGNESFAKLERTYGPIPATWTVESGGGGKHLYVLTQMQLQGRGLDEFPGIDFKGAGGCVVAAPSNHVSGKTYEHNGNWDMFDISKEPHLLFPFLVEKGARSEKAFSVDNPDAAEEDVESARKWLREKAELSFPDGTAGATFMHVCSTLIRRMRLSARQAEECILECYNPRLRAESQEEWTGDKLRHKIEDACNASHVPLGKTLAEGRAERQANFEDVRSRDLGKTGAAANQNAERTFALTESGNAERFAAQYKEKARYVEPWNAWLIWDGTKWRRDNTGEVRLLSKECVRSIDEEVRRETDDDKKKRLRVHANKSEGRFGRENLLVPRHRGMERLGQEPRDFVGG